MPLRLSVVTAQRAVVERDDVTRLVVPAAEGQITILPSHAALMSSLSFGVMDIHTPSGVEPLAILGGFIQVLDDDVSVLADAAERAEEIDLERAESARGRAERRLAGRETTPQGGLDVLRAQLAMQRAMIRIRVARRRRGAASGAPQQRP